MGSLLVDYIEAFYWIDIVLISLVLLSGFVDLIFPYFFKEKPPNKSQLIRVSVLAIEAILVHFIFKFQNYLFSLDSVYSSISILIGIFIIALLIIFFYIISIIDYYYNTIEPPKEPSTEPSIEPSTERSNISYSSSVSIFPQLKYNPNPRTLLPGQG